MVVDNMIDGETSEKGKRIQEQNVMRDLTIWLTYHDDSQIEQYGLREDDVFRLFKGNAVNYVAYKGDSLLVVVTTSKFSDGCQINFDVSLVNHPFRSSKQMIPFFPRNGWACHVGEERRAERSLCAYA